MKNEKERGVGRDSKTNKRSKKEKGKKFHFNLISQYHYLKLFQREGKREGEEEGGRGRVRSVKLREGGVDTKN